MEMPTDVKAPDLLTVQQVARLLNVHEQTVRRKIHAGTIPAVRLGARGSQLRVDRGDLDRWLYDDGDAAA